MSFAGPAKPAVVPSAGSYLRGYSCKAKADRYVERAELRQAVHNSSDDETVVTGPNNSLEYVVVYISAGAPDRSCPFATGYIYTEGRRYLPHVLAFQTNQELKVVNDDQTSHNIHPLAQD